MIVKTQNQIRFLSFLVVVFTLVVRKVGDIGSLSGSLLTIDRRWHIVLNPERVLRTQEHTLHVHSTAPTIGFALEKT